MTNDEFNLCFSKLTSNSWKFPVAKDKLPGMKTLYFGQLKEYKFKDFAGACVVAIKDVEQKCFPSVSRLISEILSGKQIPQTGYFEPKPTPDMPQARKDRITKLMADTKEIINKHRAKGTSSYEELKELGRGFR